MLSHIMTAGQNSLCSLLSDRHLHHVQDSTIATATSKAHHPNSSTSRALLPCVLTISPGSDPIQDPLHSQALYNQAPQPCSLTTNTPRPIASAPAFSLHHTGPRTETLGDRAI